jgi:hypothetical protein
MKAALIDVLLSSPGGEAIRTALRLQDEEVFTEVVHVRLRHAREQEGTCEMRVGLAKWGKDGVLTGEAADVDFRCVGVLGLSYWSDWESPDAKQPQFSPDVPQTQSPLEIDTEDRFRVHCARVEVLNVRPYHLSDEPSSDQTKCYIGAHK